MNRKMIYAVLLTGLGANMAFASAATGAISKVIQYGDGTILVTGAFDFGSICTNGGAFVIPNSHPYRKELLTQVLSAKTAGISVTVEATNSPSCSSNPAAGYPVMGSSNTYIRLD